MFSARRDFVFILACLLVFALDVWAGSQVSPWSLYLLPVFVSGWLFGRRHALMTVALAVGLIGLAAVVSGHPFLSHWEFAMSWLNRAASLVCVAWLLGLARRTAETEDVQRAWAQSRQ
jgi:uncharacterized ion transporter superfamily protein YfcC